MAHIWLTKSIVIACLQASKYLSEEYVGWLIYPQEDCDSDMAMLVTMAIIMTTSQAPG